MLKINLLNHFKAMRLSAEHMPNRDVAIQLDVMNFQLTASSDNQTITFYPQFIEHHDGKRHYTDDLSEDSVVFSGWRPYKSVEVSSFTDKIKFKQLLEQHNFPTPAYSHNDHLQPVVVKSTTASFAEGIYGPFPSSNDYALRDNQFYEQFIEGALAKIWFCDDNLICIEHQDMPSVTGDGHHSIRALVKNTLKHRPKRSINWPALTQVLSHYGMTLEDVLPADKKQIIDIRYGSPLIPPFDVKLEVNERRKLSKQLPMLDRLASLLAAYKPNLIPCFIYSVDAIIDAHNQVWLLEANSNPFVHPQLYPVMLHSCFEQASATARG